jgi:hypothetical protein
VIENFNLKAQFGSWTYTLDVSKFAPGVYAVSYANDKGIAMKRFVIE